jgi:general secretion pathway protein K
LIRGAVQVAGVGGRDADAVTDAILDWRDPDDQRRPRGAERSDYERAGKVGPRNGPFATVEELREVMGVTPELYRRLEPIVTVNCLQAGIDPRVAPLAALRAIPGIRDREVEEVAALRRRSLDRGDPLPGAALSGIARYSAQSPGFAYTIQSTARLDDGAEYRLEAQVWLQPEGERPYALLGLREGSGISTP